MVAQCVSYRIGPLRICDTKIISICPDGASQFGCTPQEIVWTHLSDWQSMRWRAAGHRRYLDRKLGKRLAPEYVVEIQRADGSRVAQRREFGGFVCGKDGGEDIYLTYLDVVPRHDPLPPFRTLNTHEQKLFRHYNGDGTVAGLRQMAATHRLPIALQESFRHIIREADELSSGLFAGKYRSPLDLLLSPDVAVCWHGKHGPKVRPRFQCEECGSWKWYGRAKARAECTGCGHAYRDYRKS